MKDISRKMEEIKEVATHNQMMVDEYKKGQEGVDYAYTNPENDYRYLTERKLRKIFKKQIDQVNKENECKDPNSEKAKFERNKNRLNSINIRKDEVKYYPGSAKGKLPQEDPQFYAQWFMANRPESLKAIEQEVVFPVLEANRRKVRLAAHTFRCRAADETSGATTARTSRPSSTTSSTLRFGAVERVCACSTASIALAVLTVLCCFCCFGCFCCFCCLSCVELLGLLCVFGCRRVCANVY